MMRGTKSLVDRVHFETGEHYLRADILRTKAERYIYQTFEVKTKELSGLVLLWNYLKVSGRDGVALQTVLNWGGRNPGWKRGAKYTLLLAIEKGLIERRKSYRGFSLVISIKGRKILQALIERMALIDGNLEYHDPNHPKRERQQVSAAA